MYILPQNIYFQMKCQQEHIKRTLDAKNIDYEEIDIADPAYVKEKEFMKDTMKLADDDLVTLPPQIFTEDKWKGVIFFLLWFSLTVFSILWLNKWSSR